MITQVEIFKVFFRKRHPLKLYGYDDGHLWDLAGEIARSKEHRMREIAEDLIHNNKRKCLNLKKYL